MGNAAEKEEIRRIFEARHRYAKRRSARVFLILKIGAGYAAMACFTVAALIFSALSLGSISRTARDITYADLPAASALLKLRFSLLAQERFAGRYAIIKDRAFVDLYREREKEFRANLAQLKAADALQEAAVLERLYREYQAAVQPVFEGTAKDTERGASAGKLLQAIDGLYLERQRKLHAALEKAEKQRRSTVKWTIGISCAGFLLTVWIAPWVTSRIFQGTRKLQIAAHRALAGDFSLDPRLRYCDEVGDLAEDVEKLARNLLELEQLTLEVKPLSGDPAVEKMLEEQLQAGTPFTFCHAHIGDLKFFSDQHGYADACRLLRLAGVILQDAVRVHSPEGTVYSLGGNGFVMMLSPSSAARVCEAASEAFVAELTSRFGSHASWEVVNPAQEQAAGSGKHPPPIASLKFSAVTCGGGHLTSVVAIAETLDGATASNGAGSASRSALAAPGLHPEEPHT